MKTTFEERVVRSAIIEIKNLFGSYAKPSQIRNLLRDPRYYVTKRGAVRKKNTDPLQSPAVLKQCAFSGFGLE